MAGRGRARGLGLGLLRAADRQGWNREQRLWWLLWSGCPGIGFSRLMAIRDSFCGWAAAWASPPEAFTALAGLGPASCRQLERYRTHWGPDPLPRLARQLHGGRRVVLPADPAFPPALLNLERPPLRLHWSGRGWLWPLLHRRQAIAVVGTRRPSRHGLAMAEAIGAALAQAGWPVVSGLAEGIDGAVHRGCLAHGGRPVAVLGTPLERVYPRHHEALQAEVAAEGLLVSELPAGTAVQAGHFAARNRLQVGLSQAVVVVECPLRSGALHSATLAMRQELPLWVVPADAGKASAAGSNRLLAQDATVLLEPADLIRQLGPGPLAPADALPPSEAQALGTVDPALVLALGRGASLEQLCLALDQPVAVLAARLLALELRGQVRAEPGLCWRPI
ncbi:DNA-protecting protein DprA [Cyanobium sp. ATX 6E8]|nr:DNA-protecting protein DprA [Cyanobium sp. ATX 6E8]